MDKFELHITETPVKKSGKNGLSILLVILLAPVILVFAAAYGVSLLFSFIYGKTTKRGMFGTKGKKSVHKTAFDLIKNDTIQISLQDIEESYGQLLDEWCDMTNNQAECLFLAKTNPVIDGIHGRFITAFLKEFQNGILLQRLILSTNPADTHPVNSELVWVDYDDLTVKEMKPIGQYFLYEDKRNPNLIKGFNREKEVEIEVKITQ
ncbi:MAG: hypothetical protein IPL49_11900 [Saprospirales bacterium]|nr:hypothetical protein [Saprospirales bacterium]MBK8491554.1 hypothetical protein [Saprospirales bacterium]